MSDAQYELDDDFSDFTMEEEPDLELEPEEEDYEEDM